MRSHLSHADDSMHFERSIGIEIGSSPNDTQAGVDVRRAVLGMLGHAQTCYSTVYHQR